MVKLDKLKDIAAEKGLDVVSIYFTDLYQCRVIYLSPKKAGIAPVEEYCRDHLDYTLRMNEWIKRGTVPSPDYEGFDEMLSGEIRRLRKL